MKKIILIFALGMMFSCSNETENPNASEDAAVISLMKTSDKSTLSHSQLQEIVKYLDRKPGDAKYLIAEGISKDISKDRISSKAQSVSTEVPIDQYMHIIPVTGTVDYGASVSVSPYGPPGRWRVVYNWTVAENVFGFFDITSTENVDVIDYGRNGLGGAVIYSIDSVTHGGSYIRGVFGPLSWRETSYNNVPGQYGAFFFTNGLLEAPGYNREQGSSRYANISVIVATGGFISQ
jgi:hypothetical protein